MPYVINIHVVGRACGRKSKCESPRWGDTRYRYDGADTSVLLSMGGLAVAGFDSGVRGLGVSVPVLGEPTLRLNGLSVLPGGDTGLRPNCDGGAECSGDGVTGERLENDVGEGFHDERWKLFFLRTLALYAARIAAVASLVMLNTLPDEAEGAFERTLGAREWVRLASSRREGSVAVVGDIGTEEGPKTGENTGEGRDDSQLSYWLGVEDFDDDEEVLGSTLENR